MLGGMLMPKFLFSAAIFLALAASSKAQDFPRAEIFGGYSYLSFDVAGARDKLESVTGDDLSFIPGRLNLNGWEASLDVNLNRWVGVEGDFSGHYVGSCGGAAGLN